jgi:hypothetical protein
VLSRVSAARAAERSCTVVLVPDPSNWSASRYRKPANSLATAVRLSIKPRDDRHILNPVARTVMAALQRDSVTHLIRGAIETASKELCQFKQKKVETDCRLRIDLTVFAEIT